MDDMRGGSDWGNMSGQEKINKMGDFMMDMNQDLDRQDRFRKEDMQQMSRNGYFDKMNSRERENYDNFMGDQR